MEIEPEGGKESQTRLDTSRVLLYKRLLVVGSSMSGRSAAR